MIVHSIALITIWSYMNHSSFQHVLFPRIQFVLSEMIRQQKSLQKGSHEWNSYNSQVTATRVVPGVHYLYVRSYRLSLCRHKLLLGLQTVKHKIIYSAGNKICGCCLIGCSLCWPYQQSNQVTSHLGFNTIFCMWRVLIVKLWYYLTEHKWEDFLLS